MPALRVGDVAMNKLDKIPVTMLILFSLKLTTFKQIATNPAVFH